MTTEDTQVIDNEQEFADAFAEAAGDSTPANKEDETPNAGDSSAANDVIPDDKDQSVDSPRDGSDKDAAASKEGEAKGKDGEDLEAEYTKTANELKLTKSRHADLARQYQQMKLDFRDLQQSLASGTSNKTQDDEDDSKIELPESYKQFKEEYSDIAVAIEEYLSTVLKASTSKIDKRISKEVAPIKEQFGSYVGDAHMNSIRAAHKDVIEIVQSGDLDAWQNELSSIERRGVAQVREAGTAEEVIDMLNKYKKDRGITSETTTTKSKSDPKQSAEDDEYTQSLVKKVMAAISVPTKNKSTPDTSNTNKGIDPDDFDAAFAEAIRNDK
jgi:hypothetical protein